MEDLVRLRDAMNDERVPQDPQQRIRDYFEEETHPAARTLAIFADEDDLFEVYCLQVDVPESFRWGDPNVAPLTLVMEEYEPYGAAAPASISCSAKTRTRTFCATSSAG